MAGAICDVCGNSPTVGVCASRSGAISHAYCASCLAVGAEPWGTLVGGLFGCTRETVVAWMKPVIEASCKVANKTEDELWAAVAQMELDFLNTVSGTGG